RAGQHVQHVGVADHVHFQPVAHAGLLQVDPHLTIEQADGREVLYAVEPDLLSWRSSTGISRNGSVPHTPASTGVSLTTGSTSRAMSTTIAFASPYGSSPASEPRPP